FLLVTQNIDTLHEQAGSRRVAKVHGSSDRLRCTAPPCRLAAPAGSLPRAPEIFERFLAEPRRRHLPLCPECGCALRAHVLLFDEHYQEHLDYRFDETVEALSRADLLVFVGTSFSVGITDLALRLALGRRVPVYSIDPGAAGPPVAGVISIPRPAEEALPEVVGQLAGGREETA
ncbi:MAG: Sir2 family NAD-dependent protein deacetylase, partial [Thermoanaerobaculia bacterium]|nr:Sir2 family NAD-dependent protein deacetylase [Thermoanaerobaculia bacterium]